MTIEINEIVEQITVIENGTFGEGGGGVALGETSTTAYRGDRGKIAYDHSQLTTGNPHGTAIADISGLQAAIDGKQPLDSDLTAIAALTTTAFGRGLLTEANAASIRSTIGAGTSSFDGAYSSLTGIPSTFTPSSHNQAWSTITSTPTTLSGYGITDAQPLDADLTAIAALTGTNTIYYRSGANTWSAVTIGSNLTFSGGTLSASSGGATTFLGLTDTPASFSGQSLKSVRVNSGETALEFFTPTGGGNAQTGDPLSQFASTTSAQLAGVISDETGMGALVFANSPTLISPALGTVASGNIAACTGYTFANLASTPTTLSGYGITDAQPLDSDLTAIAALTTTSFGRSLLTQSDAAATRTTIGAGTSSFDGAYSSLSGIPSTFTPAAHNQAWSTITSTPTTLSGYGITDAQALDSDLTDIAALTPTNDDVLQRKAGAWTNRTMSQLKTDLSLTKSDVGLSNVPNTDATARANHTGTQTASTISDFASTVRATVLTGLSTASAVAIAATDTILDAFGKLQALLDLRAPQLKQRDAAFASPIVFKYPLIIRSAQALTIEGVDIYTASGTVTADVEIGTVSSSTDVTGLAAISVSSVVSTPNASAANTVAVDDSVWLNVTAVSSPGTLFCKLRYRNS